MLSAFEFYSKNSTVVVNKNIVTNHDVRRSRILKGVTVILSLLVDYGTESKLFDESIKKILPMNLRKAYYSMPCDYSFGSAETENNWDMMVYDEGDFFAKHTDGRANDTHYCTLLLLPPKKINRYTGGDLIIYDGPVQSVIRPHSTDWTLIGLPLNVPHECTPIQSGRRIVFKTKFVIPSLIDDVYGLELSTDKESENVAESTTIGLYDKIFDKFIASDCNTFVIVLEKRYDSVDPNCLIGEDRNLFFAIKRKFPGSNVKLFIDQSATPNMMILIKTILFWICMNHFHFVPTMKN